MSCAALRAAALGSSGQQSGYISGGNIWRFPPKDVKPDVFLIDS